jgi:hypothetical protein
VIPLYRTKVVTTGCHDLQGMQSKADQHIRRKYGADELTYSQMEIRGDVYSALLKSPALASRLIADGLIDSYAQDRIFHFLHKALSQPNYLHLFNSVGLPTRTAVHPDQSNASSNELRTIEAQLYKVE